MDSKGDAEPQEERPSSPMRVLQHFSGGAFKVAGEALHMSPMGPGGHRRCQSELGSRGVERNNSLQKLKSHVNKAWRWGGKSREDALANFNPEVMANQKRQWYQLHPKSLDCVNNKEPTSLFEHFVIVGLHPDANLEAVEHSFARRKKWEKDKGKPEFRDCRKSQQQKVIEPTLEPQLLFKYPPAKKLTLRMKDLAPFCFPEGVKAWLLERTPSLSELNELVYGQIKLQMCLSINSTRQFRTFVVKVIPSVIAQSCNLIAQERLNRITEFINEMSLSGSVPSSPKLDDQMRSKEEKSPENETFSEWMDSAIPLDGAAAIAAAAAGIISDDESQQLSPKIRDYRCQSPVSGSASDASDSSQFRDTDKEDRKNLQVLDNCEFKAPETLGSIKRMHGNCKNDQASPKPGTPLSSQTRVLERLGSFESLFSPVRSRASEDEDDFFSNNERDYGDELLMEWATENKNDLLQIVCRYHAQPIPPRGSDFVFHPLEHLQAIQYIRHSVAALGFGDDCSNCSETALDNTKLAAAEEALSLSVWTMATTCRVLSLDSVGIQHKPDYLNARTTNRVLVDVQKDKLFVDTQLFTVLSDSRLTSFESGES
ncbi:hypothetical protein VIGAN_04315600 [Vigna angularis var. angularis]|uniref:Uncharacterized protein n=1 Tax=Vigna angularis var. angularis TaxID=157739 RepID=A0A0S3RYB2_PHAAN|nr:hypothetical protein VIGAN_04315600 [Vigna angularis var. angularis]